jgi:CheY-like chemotaxis protein
VALAEDGAEAVAKFQAGDFDAIVMDIQIPILDGLQATRKIRELEKDRERRTPIIALTAHVARGDRDACFRADMDDYIPKPVDPMQFEHVVKRHLLGPTADFEWARAISLMGSEEALLERASDFVELGEGQLRAIMDSLHRGDKIALWQASRTIEAEASQLSLNRLRDVAHQVAVLIGRGRPKDAMKLVDDLKQALKDAITAVRTAVGAVT